MRPEDCSDGERTKSAALSVADSKTTEIVVNGATLSLPGGLDVYVCRARACGNDP